MKSKLMLTFLMALCLTTIGLQADGGGLFLNPEDFNITGKEAGYVLLDTVVNTFSRLSGKPNQDLSALHSSMSQWMKMANVAKKEGQIDTHFHTRFKRILVVLKLSIAPDQHNYLKPLLNEEIAKFDIKNKPKTAPGRPAPVAALIAQEILSLKKYLDSKK